MSVLVKILHQCRSYSAVALLSTRYNNYKEHKVDTKVAFHLHLVLHHIYPE
jgi:hypothetical protein